MYLILMSQIVTQLFTIVLFQIVNMPAVMEVLSALEHYPITKEALEVISYLDVLSSHTLKRTVNPFLKNITHDLDLFLFDFSSAPSCPHQPPFNGTLCIIYLQILLLFLVSIEYFSYHRLAGRFRLNPILNPIQTSGTHSDLSCLAWVGIQTKL